MVSVFSRALSREKKSEIPKFEKFSQMFVKIFLFDKNFVTKFVDDNSNNYSIRINSNRIRISIFENRKKKIQNSKTCIRARRAHRVTTAAILTKKKCKQKSCLHFVYFSKNLLEFAKQNSKMIWKDLNYEFLNFQNKSKRF